MLWFLHLCSHYIPLCPAFVYYSSYVYMLLQIAGHKQRVVYGIYINHNLRSSKSSLYHTRLVLLLFSVHISYGMVVLTTQGMAKVKLEG